MQHRIVVNPVIIIPDQVVLSLVVMEYSAIIMQAYLRVMIRLVLRRVMERGSALSLFPLVLRLSGIPECVLEESIRDARRFGFLSGLQFLRSLQLGLNEPLNDFFADATLLSVSCYVFDHILK